MTDTVTAGKIPKRLKALLPPQPPLDPRLTLFVPASSCVNRHITAQSGRKAIAHTPKNMRSLNIRPRIYTTTTLPIVGFITPRRPIACTFRLRKVETAGQRQLGRQMSTTTKLAEQLRQSRRRPYEVIASRTDT